MFLQRNTQTKQRLPYHPGRTLDKLSNRGKLITRNGKNIMKSDHKARGVCLEMVMVLHVN